MRGTCGDENVGSHTKKKSVMPTLFSWRCTIPGTCLRLPLSSTKNRSCCLLRATCTWQMIPHTSSPENCHFQQVVQWKWCLANEQITCHYIHVLVGLFLDERAEKRVCFSYWHQNHRVMAAPLPFFDSFLNSAPDSSNNFAICVLLVVLASL